mgnify:FL=1
MSSEKQLSGQFDLIRTETKGVSKKSTYTKDLQLSDDTLSNIEGISEGSFLKVTNKIGDIELSTYGRVEPRTEESHNKGMGNNEVALGVQSRDAICATAGEDTVELDRVGFSENSNLRKFTNKFIGIRAATGRARKAISTDSGYRICRLREDVKQTIGIEWGDHVVIQSSEGRVRGIKALPLTAHQREIAEKRQNSKSYRSSIEETEIKKNLNPGSENLPKIHIAYAIRQALNISDKSYSGVHQPIKIHRDTRYVTYRILHDLTLPFLLTLIAALIGLDLPTWVVAVLLTAGVFILLVSTYLKSSQTLR